MVILNSDLIPPAKRPRRSFTIEFKRKIVREAQRPNVSSAAVAMSHGINPNQLKRWQRELGQAGMRQTDRDPVLLPIQIKSEPFFTDSDHSSQSACDLGHIEIQVNGTNIFIFGVVDAQALQIVLKAARL